jgi:NAD-dependent SIR2 family protein deacetylase
MTETCDGCSRQVKNWTVKEEATGKFEVCPHCGRRNDGLGRLQDRFSL